MHLQELALNDIQETLTCYIFSFTDFLLKIASIFTHRGGTEDIITFYILMSSLLSLITRPVVYEDDKIPWNEANEHISFLCYSTISNSFLIRRKNYIRLKFENSKYTKHVTYAENITYFPIKYIYTALQL